ncbi:hypothetical protein C0992_012889, partial [Termitomyces sp. T32_za158]
MVSTDRSVCQGGADTTVSADLMLLDLLNWTSALDVKHKAQAEIDAVIGSERLPTLADRHYLPYVNAVVTEVLRWNSVVPI